MEGPRLEGKIAVVTGGGTGLGRALVLALAERGADVAFSFRRARAEPKRRRRRCGRRDGGSGRSLADARRPGEMSRFVEQAVSELGGIDLLVNNVGVFRKVPLAD
jgi:3-oxoacyl-[acyl-carrier protein] reductase